MNLLLFAAAVLLLTSFVLSRMNLTFLARDRLAALDELANAQSSTEARELNWAQSLSALDSLADRLGRAGFVTDEERVRARKLQYVIVGICVLAGAWLLRDLNRFGPLLGLGVGLYVGMLAWLQYLAWKSREHTRRVLFNIPIFLEAVILLVESGLGILPAIQRSVTESAGAAGNYARNDPNPVRRYMRLVYELSAHGVPFSEALQSVANTASERVLRHTLLHLDISGTEGGALVPSLRSLSGHAHHEWKLSVEERVKRLENLVVFPVFVAVLGLMLLTAAVPLVPVLKLSDSLSQGGALKQISNPHAENY